MKAVPFWGWLWMAGLFAAGGADRPFNVLDYGAVGDGRTINTAAIQRAIEAAHASGGGTVLFPAGRWLSGKILLRSRVTLHLADDATLLAAPGRIYAEPPGSIAALIWGDQLEEIGITGGGAIEGKTGLIRSERPPGAGRCAIGLQRCKNVRISDITIRNGGGCAALLISLDGLEVNRIDVSSFFDTAPDGGQGKQGVTLDGCRNVVLRDCQVRASDDALAFKARPSGFLTASEDIAVERCALASRTSNAIQFGSDTRADFRGITIRDVEIEHAGKAGIGFTMNDGHVIENVAFTNVTMNDVCTPFHILITPRHGIGRIRHLRFENIIAENISARKQYSRHSPKGYWVATISGLAGHPVEDVVFRNVTLHYPGGVRVAMEQILPPDPALDYEPRKLGLRPASGFYVRYAKDLQFDNLRITVDRPDSRPAIVLDAAQAVTLLDLSLFDSGGADCDLLARGSSFSVTESPLVRIKDAPLPQFPPSR